MSLRIQVINQGFSPKLAKTQQREINRDVMTDVGNYWHDHYRAKHFTREGAAEYHYAPRNRGYMIRKAKVKGHQNPLVWSGDSELRSRIKDVRAFSPSADRAYVRVVLHAPTLNYIPKGGSINLSEEMTRVSEGELRTLAEVLAESQSRHLAALRDGSAVTIQG